MDYKRLIYDDKVTDMVNEKDDEYVIDLSELSRFIFKHIKLVILFSALFGCCSYFGTKLLIAPTYTASTSIYLTPQISVLPFLLL